MSPPSFPNAHVLLRLSQRAPATPARDTEVEIWLKDRKFRIRDRSGRRIDEILGDLTAPRGLGMPARTMEDLMDLESARARKDSPPTDLFGDLATDEGWVYPPGQARWPIAVEELVPAAEQILSQGKSDGLAARGTANRLGRTCTQYEGVVDVTEDGRPFRNAVVRAIATPFLLFEETHDATAPGLSYTRELLSIDEGAVSDADVTPPL